MAKGDSSRAQNTINQQSQIAQYGTGGGNTGLTGLQNQFNQQFQQYEPQFQASVNKANEDYSGMQAGYQDYMKGLAPQYQNFQASLEGMKGRGGAGLINQNEVNSAMKGYQNFADTGGYSAADIQSFKQQNMAPVRAAYQQANDQLDQSRGLSGGYSPNFAAAASQMARQQGQGMANAQIGSNAAMGQMVQQGKLAGLGGLSSTALQNQAQGIQAASANNQYDLGVAGLGLQGMGQYNNSMLGGLEGQRNLYSSTPGMANLLGNYVNNITQGQQYNQGLQNQLSLGTMNAQINKGNMPGDFRLGLGNLESIYGLASKTGKGLAGLFSGGNNRSSGGSSAANNSAYSGISPNGFGNLFKPDYSARPIETTSRYSIPHVSTEEDYRDYNDPYDPYTGRWGD